MPTAAVAAAAAAAAAARSYEDEFDSNLRELFMVGLLHVACLCIALTIVYYQSGGNQQQQYHHHVTPYLLTAICLCFAQTSLLISPLNEFIYCFPHVHEWLGINGTRLSYYFALVSSMGGKLCFFVLNPLAFLIAESSGVGGGSDAHAASMDGSSPLWTALVELALLLSMLFCAGVVLFHSAWETVSAPVSVLSKLASIVLHLPGWLLFMQCAPSGLVHAILYAMGSVAPRPRRSCENVMSAEEEIEYKQMLRWLKRRQRQEQEQYEMRHGGSNLMAILVERKEALQDSKWHQAFALGRLASITLLTILVCLRMVLPNYVSYLLFFNSRVIKVCPQLYFLFVSSWELGKRVREERNHLARSSLRTLRLVALLLCFTLSSPLVLASLFDLFDIFPRVALASHEFFKNRLVVWCFTWAMLTAFAWRAMDAIPAPRLINALV